MAAVGAVVPVVAHHEIVPFRHDLGSPVVVAAVLARHVRVGERHVIDEHLPVDHLHRIALLGDDALNERLLGLERVVQHDDVAALRGDQAVHQLVDDEPILVFERRGHALALNACHLDAEGDDQRGVDGGRDDGLDPGDGLFADSRRHRGPPLAAPLALGSQLLQQARSVGRSGGGRWRGQAAGRRCHLPLPDGGDNLGGRSGPRLCGGGLHLHAVRRLGWRGLRVGCGTARVAGREGILVHWQQPSILDEFGRVFEPGQAPGQGVARQCGSRLRSMQGNDGRGAMMEQHTERCSGRARRPGRLEAG